jgi:hypothetical protein
MTRVTVMLGVLFCLNMITGCDVIKSDKDQLLFNKIEELELQVEQEQWDEALFHMNEFKDSYENRKWKLQLLGNLEDYKSIELEIELFNENVQEKDGLESKKGLSHIKYRLFSIFSL